MITDYEFVIYLLKGSCSWYGVFKVWSRIYGSDMNDMPVSMVPFSDRLYSLHIGIVRFPSVLFW